MKMKRCTPEECAYLNATRMRTFEISMTFVEFGERKARIVTSKAESEEQLIAVWTLRALVNGISDFKILNIKEVSGTPGVTRIWPN